jgi:hypothetical protein
VKLPTTPEKAEGPKQNMIKTNRTAVRFKIKTDPRGSP